MFRIRWLSSLDKVVLYLLDPNSKRPLKAHIFDEEIEAVDYYKDFYSKYNFEGDWGDLDSTEYTLCLRHNNHDINYYIISLSSILQIPTTQSEQLSYILENKKEVLIYRGTSLGETLEILSELIDLDLEVDLNIL